jgi:hypothetical protein
MFDERRARRQRARQRQRAARILEDARTASEAARDALRRSRGGPSAPADEIAAEAIEAAILGAILPSVSASTGKRRGRDPEGRRERSGVGLALLVGVALGVGVAAWARREPAPPPGGEDEEWELAGGDPLQDAKRTINASLDHADAAIRRAVGATAASMGLAVDAMAEAAGPTAERVTGQLKVARGRATKEVIRALDDVEDVWGEEDDSTQPTPKVPKRPTPRKPVQGKPASASGEGKKRATSAGTKRESTTKKSGA